MPLDTLLARHATCRGDRVALVFEAHRLTHAEIDRRANRTANALHALGVQKGDRVALLLDNSLELLHAVSVEEASRGLDRHRDGHAGVHRRDGPSPLTE